MQDSEYLNKYIKALKVIEDKRIMMVSHVDSFKFQYVSEAYKKYITNEDVIGKRLRDTNHPGKEASDELLKISLNVIKAKKSASFFVVFKFPQLAKTLCFLYTLTPIINPETDNIVGLLGEFQLIDLSFIARLFSLISSFSFPQSDTPGIEDLKLTNREKEILFLLTLGYGYKEIAYILSGAKGEKTISANTVNSIIRRQLFKKFMVTNIPELIIKSGQVRALESIPDSIIELKNGIYEISFYNNDSLNDLINLGLN